MYCNLSLECLVNYDVTTAHKVFLDSHWCTVASFIFHGNEMGPFSEATRSDSRQNRYSRQKKRIAWTSSVHVLLTGFLMASLPRCTQYQVMWNLSSDENEATQWPLNPSKLLLLSKTPSSWSVAISQGTQSRGIGRFVMAINEPIEADWQIGNII